MGAIKPLNLSIKFSLRYHMPDLRTKFEEDWTKIVVAIVDERFVRTHRQTERYTHVFIYLSNAINCIGETKHSLSHAGTVVPECIKDDRE